MASTFKKGNRIYISYYESSSGRARSRSTGLLYSKENLKIANKMAEEFQKKLEEAKERLSILGIRKNLLEAAIKQFLKNNNNKDPKTISEYNWFFERFTRTFDRAKQCTEITKLRCEEWLVDLRTATFMKNGLEVPYSKNTLQSYNKVLKKFLNFLFEYNYVPVFKLNKDVIHRAEVKPVEIFAKEDLNKLINEVNDKNSNFRTTFYLLLFTGLRPSDIYNLKIEDIDQENNVLHYYSEKSDKYFQVPLHSNLIPILKERMAEVKSGKLLEYETINNIGKAYRRFLRQIGLSNKGYTLRTFRKNFITLMHNGGADLATVSKLVGHKQITTTQKYYNQLSISKQSQEIAKLNIVLPDRN